MISSDYFLWFLSDLFVLSRRRHLLMLKLFLMNLWEISKVKNPKYPHKPTESPDFLKDFSRWTWGVITTVHQHRHVGECSLCTSSLRSTGWLCRVLPQLMFVGAWSPGEVLLTQALADLCADWFFRSVSLGIWWCPCFGFLVAALVTN